MSISHLLLLAGLGFALELDKEVPERAYHREPLPEHALLRLGSTHFRAEGKITALALSPGRKLLAASDADGVVYLWDRISGKRIHRLNANVPAGGLAFSADGKRLAALNRVGQGAVWDLCDGRLITRLSFGRGGNIVPAQLRFTPDGKQLAFCLDARITAKGNDEYDISYHVYLVNVDNGKLVRHLVTAGATERLLDAALALDGRLVAALVATDGREDADLRIVDVKSGKVMHNVPGPWAEITFTPDGKVLLQGGKQFTFVEPYTAHVSRCIEHGEFFPPKFAGLDRDATMLVAYQRSFTGDVFVWDLTSAKQIKKFETREDCCVVSDGEQLLMGHGTVILAWDLRTGKEVPMGHMLDLAKKKDTVASAVARLLEEVGELDGAEKLYKEAVSKSKKPEDVLIMAAFYGRHNRMKEAMEVCTKARQTCAPEAVAEASISVLYMGKASPNDCKDVSDWLEGLIRKEPKMAFLENLAAVRYLQERYADILSIYRDMDAKKGADGLILNNMAWLVAVQEKNGPEAMKLMRRALDMAGPTADLLNTRAVIYLALGEPTLAVKDLEDAVIDAPTADQYFHLALAHQQGKNVAAARQAYNEAKRLGLNEDEVHPLERPAYRQLVAELQSTTSRN